MSELILNDNEIVQIGENVFEDCLKINMSNSVKNELSGLKFKGLNKLDYSDNEKINWLTFVSPYKNLTLYLNNVQNKKIPKINISNGFHIESCFLMEIQLKDNFLNSMEQIIYLK